MNTTERQDRTKPKRISQVNKLAEMFADHPNQWIDMTTLGTRINAWAVHSRIADLRRTRQWNVENRIQTCKMTGMRLSFYRYVPE